MEQRAGRSIDVRDLDDGTLLAAAGTALADAALAELFRRYERPLRCYPRRRLEDRMAAEELVQDTLVRLWRMAPRYDANRGTVECLVFTIASRVLVDALRRRRPTEPLGDLQPLVIDHSDGIDLALAVRDALATLSPEHRAVVELAYFDGLSQRQVATSLGIALGTVKTRTWWALRNLHAALVPMPLAA